MAVNYKLKTLREEKNLSQQSMANILNVTVAAYNRKENGTRSFTIDEANKVAIFFNTTIENVFFNKSFMK